MRSPLVLAFVLPLTACDPASTDVKPDRASPSTAATASGASPKGADETPSVDDRAALEAWADCGNGKSTGSVLSCQVIADWAKGEAVPVEAAEGWLFGSCYALENGNAKVAQTRWMLGQRTDEGLKAAVLKRKDHAQQRVFERLAHVVDHDIGKAKPADVKVVVEEVAPAASLAPLRATLARQRDGHVLVVDPSAVDDAVRFCRLAPLGT